MDSATFSSILRQNRRLEGELNNERSVREKLEGRLYNNWQKERAYQQRIQCLEGELRKVERENNLEISRLEEELKESKSRADCCNLSEKEFVMKIANLECEISELQLRVLDMDKVSAERMILQTKCEISDKRKIEMESEVSSLKDSLEAEKTKVSNLIQRNEILLREKLEKEAEAASKANELMQVIYERKAMEDEKQRLEQEILDLVGRIKAMESKIMRYQEENIALRAEKRSMRAEYEEKMEMEARRKNDRFQKLVEQVEALEREMGEFDAQILDAKEKSRSEADALGSDNQRLHAIIKEQDEVIQVVKKDNEIFYSIKTMMEKENGGGKSPACKRNRPSGS